MPLQNGEFDAIYTEFQPKILRYLTHMVGEADAEDLTQEVFTRVGLALVYFRGESSLATWIYRIATNTAIDHLRSAPYQRTQEESNIAETDRQKEPEIAYRDVWTGEEAISIEQELVRKQMNDCIRDFIERLPENYKTVLVLGDLEGFSNQEIAEILAISLGSVKIRLHRAREKLKVELVMHCDAYWVEGNQFLPNLKGVLRSYKESN